MFFSLFVVIFVPIPSIIFALLLQPPSFRDSDLESHSGRSTLLPTTAFSKRRCVTCFDGAPPGVCCVLRVVFQVHESAGTVKLLQAEMVQRKGISEVSREGQMEARERLVKELEQSARRAQQVKY